MDQPAVVDYAGWRQPPSPHPEPLAAAPDSRKTDGRQEQFWGPLIKPLQRLHHPGRAQGLPDRPRSARRCWGPAELDRLSGFFQRKRHRLAKQWISRGSG